MEKEQMNIPNKLKIGGLVYDVILENGKKEHGSVNIGATSSSSLKIWIEKEMPKSLQISTLIHEVLESINYQNDLNLTHQTITTLENNLYQVLNDNKLLKE